MSTHTPGPWRLDCRRSMTGKSYVYRITAPHGEDIVPYLDMSNGSDTGDGVSLANARLIAAAPDLLESLRMAVKYLRGENMGSVMLPKFEAAIAKAEGR